MKLIPDRKFLVVSAAEGDITKVDSVYVVTATSPGAAMAKFTKAFPVLSKSVLVFKATEAQFFPTTNVYSDKPGDIRNQS
jgi:hypothetical protein